MPDKAALAAIKADTLAWLNERRMTLGMPTLAEIPQGAISAPFSCPIARALTGRTEKGEGISFVAGSYTGLLHRPWLIADEEVEYPTVVVDFIEYFDAGDYPELEESSDA